MSSAIERKFHILFVTQINFLLFFEDEVPRDFWGWEIIILELFLPQMTRFLTIE